MAQSISNLAVGAKVKLGKLHNTDIIWKIADKNHSGYPSNSVTLVTDQIVKLLCYDAKEPTNSDSSRRSYGNNRYIYSNIRQWLNSAADAGAWYTAQHSADAAPSTQNVKDGYNPYDGIAGFLNAFSADERAALLDTTLEGGINSADGSGYDTFTDKVFLPSATEVGMSSEYNDGSKLACFSNNSSRIATVTAACAANNNYTDYGPSSGAAWNYWVRTPYTGHTIYVYGVQSDGSKYAMNNCFIGYIGVRPACNLSSNLTVSDSTDADGCYTFIFNTAPTAPSTITVPSSIFGGQNASITWDAATDVDGNLSGYVLEQKVNAGTWAQIYKGSARTYSAPITYGWESVQFRVKAYDAAGAESAYTTSAIRTVTNNLAPVISGSDGDLGSYTGTAPSFSYTVTDENGDTVTVVEKLDGTTLRNYTVTLGNTNTLTFDAAAWQKILNGSHTLTITATDTEGASVTRTLTFTKAVTSIDFVQTVAMAADDMPTKALVNIQGHFPAGCSLTVMICNNGNDASPTWEDITNAALNGTKHFFTNTTKTASAWGVKIKVQLLRGSATETCYIQSIGGNFA